MAEPSDETGTPEGLRWQSARYLVAPNLFEKFDKLKDAHGRARVIVELNVDYPGGLDEAKKDALEELGLPREGDGERPGDSSARRPLTSRHNLFVSLTREELVQVNAGRQSAEDQAEERRNAVARGDAPPDPKIGHYPIYKIWADEKLKPFVGRSVRTIKADACLTTFGSDGKGIVVAVADSGIDETHKHFLTYDTLNPPDGIAHRDFTNVDVESPLTDAFGHGTHVGGIIAGRFEADAGSVVLLREEHVEDPARPGATGATITVGHRNADKMVLQGVAPKAKLVSLKVLDEAGQGYASSLIAALDYLFELNDSGRKVKVHCLNLSLGYPFEAEWYAAGQSPLCVAVSRLVSSGMVVVAAAGNDGSIRLQSDGASEAKRYGLDQSINDPGNAEAAITVGSTHAESPHLYGVSYFSSRGPTADGRVKPDLLAPGERILSCAGQSAATESLKRQAKHTPDPNAVYYREESGTSMAAPHVAGAVAAFLSVQGEFIGRPDAVKKVFMNSCTDLGRKRDFQGAGLIDLMRAVQSV
jgi:subtilisin family serine protease